MITPFQITSTVVIGTIVAIYVPLCAEAHEALSGMKYDQWCCNNQDCAPIPHHAVKVTKDGYEITIRPGEHPMVTKTQHFKVAYGAVRQSTDSDYHICLYPFQDTFRCFYAPPMGS